jgi:hypothetical protein
MGSGQVPNPIEGSSEIITIYVCPDLLTPHLKNKIFVRSLARAPAVVALYQPTVAFSFRHVLPLLFE